MQAAPDVCNLLLLFVVQRLRAVSSRAMAQHVFSTPELRQCIKADLLWQLQLALDIRQDEVGSLVAAGLSSTSSTCTAQTSSPLQREQVTMCVTGDRGAPTTNDVECAAECVCLCVAAGRLGCVSS